MADRIISRRNVLAGAGLGFFASPFQAIAAPTSPGCAGGSQGAAGGSQGSSLTDYGAKSGAQFDASPAFNSAFAAQSRTRTAPPGLPGWGVGSVFSPRGLWFHRTPISFMNSQIGFTMRGEATFATAHVFNINKGAAIPLNAYIGVMLSDFMLKNVARNPGDAAGVALDPHGGGGLLSIKRVTIDGFNTAIRVQGTENGDKTLVEQVTFGTAIGYDNVRNKQAIGWTFLNCAGDCRETHFKLGGAGENAIINYTGDVYGSLIKLPESSGNSGSGRANYLGSRTTVMSSKLEYHGSGDRMLIDARESLALTDSGGSNCDVVLREVSIASGTNWPDPSRHTIIQVGNDHAGSDAIRVKQEGGTIEGIIKYGSEQQGALNRRWSFRDALRAPNPSTVQLLGPGSHPLMEWRANENVPVDQYRGGEAFTGAIDSQKAFLWRHVGSALLNTGSAKEDIEGRVGDDFLISPFPRGTCQQGLAAYLDEPLRGGDIEITQYLSADFKTPLAKSLLLPEGSAKGLYKVHDKWFNLEEGQLHVRITANAAGLVFRGALVVQYFPYMGT